MRLVVPRLSFDELRDPPRVSWREWKDRVAEARERSLLRFKGGGISCNAEMGPALVQAEPLGRKCEDLLRRGAAQFHWSARAIHRIVKVARSVADLRGNERIQPEDLLEALGYRMEG
jgi:magnesium chelatase family protein